MEVVERNSEEENVKVRREGRKKGGEKDEKAVEKGSVNGGGKKL